MTDAALQSLVLDALDNAIENGYAMIEMTNEAIADDLVTCDADLEKFEPEQLLPFIQIWRERNE